MLNFFRINDPYRLIAIFLILLLIRVPSLLSENLVTIPELNYMLVGEKVASGSQLYSDVWDGIAPLSALIYSVIDYLFGRSQLVYQLLAYLLICYQVFIFNRFLLTSRAYAENTYVPGLVYGLLASICYDMNTLTPFLMGMTFILLALNNIFSHIEVRAKRDEDILNIGLYIGIATIIYLPYCIFTLCSLVIFTFFTGTIGRRYAMMTFGFLLPILLSAAYFYLTDRLDDFIFSFFSPFTLIKKIWFISLQNTLIFFFAPISFFLLSFFRIAKGARLTNYQSRLTQTMFVWLLFGIIFCVLADSNSPNVYIVLVAPVAFYISHYYLARKRGIFTELSFLLFFALIVSTSVMSHYDSYLKRYFDDSDYLIKEGEYIDLEKQKVLVLDDNLRPYYYSQLATPFLNWQLASEVFMNLNYYDNVTTIYNGINDDKPDIIIDPNDILIEVFDKIPQLKQQYFKSIDGHYHLRSSN